MNYNMPPSMREVARRVFQKPPSPREVARRAGGSNPHHSPPGAIRTDGSRFFNSTRHGRKSPGMWRI